ncbi:MAG: type II secretion system protein GspJ [Pikeienuella sp.]
MSRRAPRDAGLTLLELLVALTLLGLIGVMVAGGVRFGVAVWDRGSARASETVETRVALTAIRRLLAAAEPVRFRDGTRDPPVAFDGRPDSIDWVGAMPARIAPPGEHRLTLALEDGTLVLRHAALDDRAQALPATATRAPLLGEVAAVALRYYGEDAAGVPGWQPSWRGRTTLPELVALRIERAGPGDTARPIAVIVRLAAASSLR